MDLRIINDSLGNYDVEKLNSSIISTKGVHTVKDMSKYKMLIFCMVDSTSDTWEYPSMLPYKYFKTRNSANKYVYICVYSASNLPTATFYYVSDTQISFTNLTTNRAFNIYGVN